MNNTPPPSSFREFVAREIADKTQNSLFPFYNVFSYKDKPFSAMLTYLITGYKEILKGKIASLTEGIDKTKTQIEDTKKEIDRLLSCTDQEKKDLLIMEVKENRAMTEKLMESDRLYMECVVKLLNDIKQAEDTLKPFQAAKKAIESIKESMEAIVKIRSASLKKMEHLLVSMIVPENLTDNQVRTRIESKIKITKDKLSTLEENLAIYENQLLNTNSEITKLDELDKSLSV